MSADWKFNTINLVREPKNSGGSNTERILHTPTLANQMRDLRISSMETTMHILRQEESTLAAQLARTTHNKRAREALDRRLSDVCTKLDLVKQSYTDALKQKQEYEMQRRVIQQEYEMQRRVIQQEYEMQPRVVQLIKTVPGSSMLIRDVEKKDTEQKK
jgi:hypothetical protein